MTKNVWGKAKGLQNNQRGNKKLLNTRRISSSFFDKRILNLMQRKFIMTITILFLRLITHNLKMVVFTRGESLLKYHRAVDERRHGEEAEDEEQRSPRKNQNHKGPAIRVGALRPPIPETPKHQSKVPIDPRFHRMFHDSTFSFSSSAAALDKRGKLKNVEDSQNPLRKYYRRAADEQDDEEDDEEEEEEEDDEESEIGHLKSGSESENSSRGDDSTSSDEDEVENVPVIEKETKRLAIVNMDWSQVRAIDLYVLLTSFLPKDGQLMSVTVYPSEVGLKCMEEEAVHGPIGLFDSDKNKSDGSDEDDDDKEIDDEKIRAYEKRRMRYYYAVVECDSVATADYLYKTCDGTEFERTSNVLDLRFIPDSMEFKHPPRDVATEVPTNYEGLDFHTRALQHSKINLTWEEDEPQRSKILRRKFNADQLAKLELDEFLASDDGESSDDEEADDQSGKEVKKERYRALLTGGNGSDVEGDENDKDMEVTFNTGLENLSKRILEKSKQKESESVWEATLRKSREKKLARRNRSKKSSEDDCSDTDTEASEDFEQPDDFFIKEPVSKNDKVGKGTGKGKKQKGDDADQGVSRAELELLLADDQGAEQSLKGYNLKPKKTKGKREEDIPSEDKIPEVDDDDRFSALLKTSHFALDPTDPMFERSATYVRRLAQKQDARKHARSLKRKAQLAQEKKRANDKRIKRSKKDAPTQSDGASKKKDKHGLASTIQSLKEKAKALRCEAVL
ncbi:hypothetical protein Syun_005476 [Stephania yunnanensis]|uniref:NUC153 domain-containing protein n=1 Tax=Stephania yunnanensis TaxID=152371 RepID=A0AAP0Q3H5_9MAGN